MDRASRDHRQLRARILVLEEPVAHVDCQVYLLALYDLKLAFVLLHVDCDEFVADFRGVLRCVYYAEWALFECVKVLGLCLCVALPSLLPSDLIEALPEKDDEGENGPIE